MQKVSVALLWLMLQSRAAAPLLRQFGSWPPTQPFSFYLPLKQPIAAMNSHE